MDSNSNKRTTADRSPPTSSSMPASKHPRFTSPEPEPEPAAPPEAVSSVSPRAVPSPGHTVPHPPSQAGFPPKYGPATYSRSGAVGESAPGLVSWGLNSWFTDVRPEETRLGYSKLLQQMITGLRTLPGSELAPSRHFLEADVTTLSSILENDRDFERELSNLHGFITKRHSDAVTVLNSIRRILNHVCAPGGESGPDMSPQDKRNAEYVRKAWEAPFAGTADVRLLQGLRSSFAEGPRKGAAYSNNVSMLQSSGTGKTRSAAEIRSLVFAFAVILREDTRAGEFPAADSSVRELLTGPSETSLPAHMLYPGRCRKFLEVLFNSATRWLQDQTWTQTTQPLAYLEKTNAWKAFLDGQREAIYDAVVSAVRESERKVRLDEDAAKVAASDQASGLDPQEAQIVYKRTINNIHSNWADDGSYDAHAALRMLREELESVDPAQRRPPEEETVPRIFYTSQLSASQMLAAKRAAKSALKRWTSDVWPDGVSVSPGDLSPDDSKLTVLIYFDEAHTLCTRDPEGLHTKTHYDYLLSVLHDMLKDIMGLFLSTSSRLRQLAPHKALSASARQAQSELLQPPLTELPFDCKAAALASRVPTLAEVSSIRFLANFGRPLFWSVFLEYDTMNARQKTDVEDYIVHLTEAKLIGRPPGDPDLRWDRNPQNGQIAVIDVRIWIDYEPRKSTADGTEADLVATHMRLVFTVPLNREYFYSGYASEPMLAEAAARLMRRWMWGASAREAWNPVHTLVHLLKQGLLDRGERGELVARFLLTLAYDNAVRGRGEICSVGCTVSAFFIALFRDKFAKRVLAAKPDNVVVQDEETPGEDAETLGEDAETLGEDAEALGKDAETLGEDAETLGQAAEALGHVVETLEQSLGSGIVRFTHFVKLDDESGLTTRGLCAAFIRGAAFIAQPSQTKVDAILPVLLDPTKPITPQNMSAILVQIKLRVRAGTSAEYDFTAEQLGLFKDSDPQDKTHPLRQRPYVTLLMELGVKVASSERKAGSQANAKGKGKGKGKKSTWAAKPKPKASAPPKWLSNVDVATAAMRASTRKPGKDAPPKPLKHPRFNIRAYGCSSKVYKVIEEKDNSTYSSILLANQNWKEDHPRRDLRDCVARMLPTWSADNAYGWVPDKPMRDVDRAKGKKEEVVSGEKPSEWADASDDGDDDDDDDDEDV